MMAIGKWIISILGGSVFSAILSLLYCFPLWVLALPVTIPFYYIFFLETIKFTAFMQMCLVGLGILSFLSLWWNCVKGFKEDRSSDDVVASTAVIFIVVGYLSIFSLICLLCFVGAGILWLILIAASAIFGAMLDFDIVTYLSSELVLWLIWGITVLITVAILLDLPLEKGVYTNYSSIDSSIVDKQKERSDSTRKALFHMALGAGLFYFFTRDKNKDDK